MRMEKERKERRKMVMIIVRDNIPQLVIRRFQRVELLVVGWIGYSR